MSESEQVRSRVDLYDLRLWTVPTISKVIGAKIVELKGE